MCVTLKSRWNLMLPWTGTSSIHTYVICLCCWKMWLKPAAKYFWKSLSPHSFHHNILQLKPVEVVKSNWCSKLILNTFWAKSYCFLNEMLVGDAEDFILSHVNPHLFYRLTNISRTLLMAFLCSGTDKYHSLLYCLVEIGKCVNIGTNFMSHIQVTAVVTCRIHKLPA